MKENEVMNAEDFMSRKGKPRLKAGNYTVLVIPDSAEGTKSLEFTLDKIAKILVLSFAIVIVLTSLIVSMLIRNYRLSHDYSYLDEIAQLEEDNKRLADDKKSLTEMLSKSDDEKEELLMELSEHEAESAIDTIPSGYPVKGDAFLLEDERLSDAVKFGALCGALVIATGEGDVVSVTTADTLTTIVIDHGNGYKTDYITNGITCIRQGARVSRGDTLAVITEDDDEFTYMIELGDSRLDPMDIMER